LLGLGEEPADVVGLRHVSLDGDGLAVLLGNALDNGVRTGLAAGVVDNDRSSLRRQLLRDGRADSLGSTRDDGNFAFKTVHGKNSVSMVMERVRNDLRPHQAGFTAMSRNLIVAATPRATNNTKAAPWASRKGDSVCVGAAAFSTGTFRKDCT